MPPKSECQPQHKPEIPEDFLESCMTNDEDRFVSEEKIVESITQDMPDLGNELNLMIGQYIANLVDKYIMEQVEDYADDYYLFLSKSFLSVGLIFLCISGLTIVGRVLICSFRHKFSILRLSAIATKNVQELLERC